MNGCVWGGGGGGGGGGGLGSILLLVLQDNNVTIADYRNWTDHTMLVSTEIWNRQRWIFCYL